MPYWIKERNCPRVGGYYVAKGKLSVARAKEIERTNYGTNTMYRFETRKEYEKQCRELRVSIYENS